jgi:hypothetical protein
VTARKRWRTQLLPDGGVELHHSKRRAYLTVADWRRAAVTGGTAWSYGHTVTGVVVSVDEREGHGWQVYERIDFGGAA